MTRVELTAPQRRHQQKRLKPQEVAKEAVRLLKLQSSVEQPLRQARRAILSRSPFTADEEMQVCRSYLIVGRVFGSVELPWAFWERVATHYNENRPEGTDERSGFDLDVKFFTIKFHMSQFSKAVVGIQELLKPRTSKGEELAAAMQLFQVMHNKPFEFLHCWLVLSLEPEWDLLCQRASASFGFEMDKPPMEENEETQLCISYLHTSKLSIIGNNQSSSRFSESLATHYNMDRPEGTAERDYQELEAKWKAIQHDMGEFCSVVSNIWLLSEYGEGDDLAVAKEVYETAHGKPFELMHCWQVLSHDPQWIAFTLSVGLSTKQRKLEEARVRRAIFSVGRTAASTMLCE